MELLKLKRTVLFFILTLLALSAFPATLIDRTIAKINDDILTESDLAEVNADAAGHFSAKKVSAFASATSETVMSMLDRALLLQEARRLKISPTNDEMNVQVEGMVSEIRANFQSDKEFHAALAEEHISLDQLKQELIKKSKTDFLVYHVINSRYSVSDEDVRKYEVDHQAEANQLASYRLRRLGIAITKQSGAAEASRIARETVARIITEGISFEEGIRKYSQVPGGNLDGGDMGYMTADKLSSEVRSAVEKLQPGQASIPVVAGGFANIFYVEGKRGAKSAVREGKFFQAREDLLKELRRKAILQVFDDRLKAIMPAEYLKTVRSSATALNNPSDKKPPAESASSTPKETKSNSSQMLLSAPTSQSSARKSAAMESSGIDRQPKVLNGSAPPGDTR